MKLSEILLSHIINLFLSFRFLYQEYNIDGSVSAVGDAVAEDEVIGGIETDKVSIEFKSTQFDTKVTILIIVLKPVNFLICNVLVLWNIIWKENKNILYLVQKDIMIAILHKMGRNLQFSSPHHFLLPISVSNLSDSVLGSGAAV